MSYFLKKKVIVALSGGVDSAVAAALLKKQGHEVTGVFFRFFGDIWTSDVQIKKVARKLGIPLKIVDARKEFKKRVIDYFISSYKNGLTPNPCVVCNKEMKFRLLLELMKKHKADFVATGHYIRIKLEFPISNFQFPKKSQTPKSKLQIANYKLLTAKDKAKDQSYFLYRLSQEELLKIIFPLGDYTKVQVRKIAKKLKLPISGGEESQDICFLQEKEISDFLGKNLKLKRGNIINEKGKVLGRHKGLPLYTIGQRKGIEIGASGPYFVLGKDIRKNELIVTNDPKQLLVKSFAIRKASWVSEGIKYPLKAQVQIRYHAEKIPAIIEADKSGSLIVKTKKPLRAVSPGQSAVFYKENEVLGGGIIK